VTFGESVVHPHTRQTACDSSTWTPAAVRSAIRSDLTLLCRGSLVFVVRQSWCSGKYAVFAPETWIGDSRSGARGKLRAELRAELRALIHNVSFLTRTV